MIFRPELIDELLKDYRTPKDLMRNEGIFKQLSKALTDTAYRATSDSAAYGHYDLLTTIFHETSHLQCFIAGYSNYDSHIQ